MGRANWIRKRLQSEHYEALYYSHDISRDYTAQAIMQALPAARAVCYGDPPGFLYADNSASRKKLSLSKHGIKAVLWSIGSTGLDSWRTADARIVGIHFDMGIPCLEIPRGQLLETLKEISGHDDGVDNAQVRLLQNYQSETPIWLLLLSHFTESGLTTLTDELSLYTSICRGHIPDGAVILVKKHAGTSERILGQLAEKMRGYRVVPLSDELCALPVEYLSKLLMHCSVLSVSSSSVLIKYLYKGCRVIHALDDELIRRHFKAECAEYMSTYNSKMLDALRKMDSP